MSRISPIIRRAFIPLHVALLGVTVFSSPGCNSLLLDERFYDAQLRNWTVIDDAETVEGPSEWKVEPDGWLYQRSNIWGRRGDFLGRWYGTLLVAGDASWSDYSIRMRVKPEDDDGFGLVFRFEDPEHYYRLILIEDGLNGGPITRLDKRDGADYTELGSIKKGYRQGAQMTIEVDVVGDEIRARLDGQTLLEVKDGQYSRGGIGLFCYAQSGQAFDDVRVERR
jgi:hypothetical protein